MRRRHGYSIGVIAAALLLLVGAAPAHALTAKASLTGGVVTVSGQAAKYAPVSWEGIVVTTANKRGAFSFTTSTRPSDCIGTLSDGTGSLDVRVDGCSGVTTGLPGTGQVTVYAAGDDADIGAGGPLSYTDNADGTVTDNRTGLAWEKKTDANVDTLYTWQDALAYVAGLNAMNGGVGFAGHNDWRLPNIKELVSIVDYGRSAPSIDPIFGPTAGKLNFVLYWSSTSWAAYLPESNAWAVNFRDGLTDNAGALPFGKTSANHVRAVRGGL
jgi:hypothetical protein